MRWKRAIALQFTARNIHLDNKKPGALSWKICCSVWYWLVCNKPLACYILLVLQPFIVLFSEIQYVSKTNNTVYYIAIVQEGEDLSEEVSPKKYSVGGTKWKRWLNTITSSPLSLVGLERVFHKALDNCLWTSSVGAQISQEQKAEEQYLLLVVYHVFIKRFLLPSEKAEGIRGHLWDQTQDSSNLTQHLLHSGSQLWFSYPFLWILLL